MFDWLRNLLFSPKRRDFLEMRADVDYCLTAIRRIEGREGQRGRWKAVNDQNEELDASIAEFLALKAENDSLSDDKKKPLGELFKNVLANHPQLTMFILKKYIKL